MLKKITLTLFILAVFVEANTAQEIWSLEKCIDYAYQNSINAKRAEIGVKSAELTEKGNKWSRYPDLSLSGNYNLSFGKTVDPTNNSFTTKSIGSNSFTVSSSAILYNGNRINNTIKQSKLDTKAARADAQQIERDLALSVATAYLNVLLAKEQLSNSKQRLVQTQSQLVQTDRLIKAGTRPESDRYEILAQIARDEQLIVSRENSIVQGFLTLKQLLLLEPDYDLDLIVPNIANVSNTDNLDQVTLLSTYNTAVNNQPRIQAGNFRLQSAEKAVSIAKAGWYPTISLFGQLDSRFSTRGQSLDKVTPFFNTIPALLNGNIPVSITTREFSTSFKDTPYFKQLEDNLGYAFGVSLSMPIYQNGRTSIAVEKARLNILSTQLQNSETRQTLKSEIQQAISNANAAKKTFASSEKTVNANRIAFSNTEKRYQLGAVNTFEYTTAKNTLDQSEIDYTLAKYEYVFRLKIVDYYLGKKLTLKE